MIERLVSAPVRSLTAVGRGANARVYRADLIDGSCVAVKHYPQDVADTRDRLGVEFGALTFLVDRGIACVPRPVAASPADHVAVYEFVPGEPALATGPDESDVAEAVAFAGRLRQLGSHPTAAALPRASEACFSVPELQRNLEWRLTRLDAVTPRSEADRALRRFLDGELRPAMSERLRQASQRLQSAGIAVDTPLPDGRRTLSPSDFGFHNAIRRGGALTFIDFEYFGWDEPAKLICDFVLHPGMALGRSLKHALVTGMYRAFDDDRDLPDRVAAYHPLYAIKWCFIMLNAFLPGRADRGVPVGHDEHATKMHQLSKAEALLSKAMMPTPL